MDPSEPGFADAPVATSETVAAKAEIGDQSAAESVSAASALPDLPSAMASVEAPPLPALSHASTLQNGVGAADAAHPSEPAAQPELVIPDASSVPAIASIIDDPQDLLAAPEPVISQQPADPQALADPIVQPETSSLRVTPQPSVTTEAVDSLQAGDLAKHSPAVAEALPVAVPVAQALTPPAEIAESIPPQVEVTAHTDVPQHEELPHRSPTAPAPLPDAFLSQPAPKAESLAASDADNRAQSPAAALAPSVEDQVMTDAPLSPSKIARPRDEGAEDEPATKRLKADEDAEPVSDVKMSDAPLPSADESKSHPANEPLVTGEAPAAGETAPAAIPEPYTPRPFNADFDKPITAPQRKMLQKIITNVKRSLHAGPFKDPVDPVALNIPTYFDVIKQPMDLSTMEKKVKNSEYAAVNEFIVDFDQIIKNCETFNGPSHGITAKGHSLRQSFDKQVAQVPSGEFVEPPPPDKKSGRRTSTEAPRTTQRRESRSSVGNAKSPTAGSPASPAFALQPSGIPVIRRDSNAGDGRPRREIHPPAPKDLPYSAQKPKKKKFQWELKFCQDVLNEFKKPKYQGSSWPFLLPVDPVAMNIPTYHKVIKKPMDLGTMEQKLKMGQYENAKEFEADMKQIFFNCFKFNVPGDGVYKAGESLQKLFVDKWETKKQWIKDHAPSSSVVSPESSAEGSDDDDDDEEEEEEDDEEAEKEKEAKIAHLEAEIRNLSKELQDLRKTETAKKKPRPKPGNKSKDSKKKAKPEKKSSNKPKKAKELPYVTYEQKQDISERINSLPPERMSHALSIIRANMPNLKGEDDEIELDIDELPNEVLHKLLNFVRRYAPRAEDQVEPKRPAKPAASSKPKKNKPMGKVEQEARIKELREKLQGAGSDESGGPVAADDSSGDEDDSEESEED